MGVECVFYAPCPPRLKLVLINDYSRGRSAKTVPSNR